MFKSGKDWPGSEPAGALEFEARSGEVRLSEVKAGREVTVVAIEGGRGLCSRLAALGLLPGSRLKVTGNLGGPVLVEVKGSRISLGRGMARKVRVKP